MMNGVMSGGSKSAVRPQGAGEHDVKLALDPFLLEVADVVNATLDLDELLRRVSGLLQKIIRFDIFAILLLEPKTNELRIRFSIGHPQEVVQKFRTRVGRGITGLAAERREAVLVNDVTAEPRYIGSVPEVRSELAVPLIVKNRVIGVLDIQAPQIGYFSEEHARLLTLIASRIASAIENARLYTRASRQARILTVLNEISRELTAILDLDRLFQRIGELLHRLIDYHMFSILLLDATGTRLQHRFTLRFNEKVRAKGEIELGKGLVGYAAQHRQPVLAADVSKDSRYIEGNPETRSELVVPLIYKENVIGVLDLEHTRLGYFRDGHVRTLTTLAAQIAIAIENARLYERIARQEHRMERELAMARQVQYSLLPQTRPRLEHAEIAARFVPAHTIGGDLYDFLEYSQGRQGIALGDVSGKGAPAALYAALASGIMRSTSGAEPSPGEMLAAINASLNERRLEAHFLALLYAVWDDDQRVMQIANSGLPRPIHCRDGKTERLEATGLPLGLFEDPEYDEVTIQAAPGDVFVFYSDGISDAGNRTRQSFGDERVGRVVTAHCRASADKIVQAIFDAVAEHSEGVAHVDDETVVVVKVKG
jgi:sigma-B regulation protein RsbU (phosphoserine phosphatase)